MAVNSYANLTIRMEPLWRLITITREIFQVGGQGLTAPEDAAIYLINFDGHAALVDAGAGRGQKRLLGHLAALGIRPEQIEYLLLPHCHYDHTGGAGDLREKLGCPVVIHELDADFLERRGQRLPHEVHGLGRILGKAVGGGEGPGRALRCR